MTTEIRKGDAIRVRNRAGGYLANDHGQPWVMNVMAVDPVLGVQAYYACGPWESARRTWFAASSVERIESLNSPNDCFWTGVHDGCRHARRRAFLDAVSGKISEVAG
jgi:hypothetical protein